MYVTEFMGLHTIDPVSGDFSIGAKGHRIINGEITTPVSGVTIASNLLEFMKNIAAAGNDLTYSYATAAPTLVVDNVSSLGNKTKRIILLALSALLLCALPAFAAEKIELWNGDIRKGSVSVRMNGTLREMAVDEVVSALGFAPKNDGTSLVVTMGGKKIEFWNGSNIVRARRTIISFPTPVVTKDGHWWGEGRSLLSAFDSFYKAIGQKAAFRWGDTKTVAAAQPAPKIQPKQSAPVKKPAQPAKPKPKAETPKAEPKQEAQAPAKATAPAPKPRAGRKPIVVIDAGHGGHDPGAVANKIREKDINLRAATQLAKILKEKGVDARPHAQHGRLPQARGAHRLR